jgi:hypothetical protein
VRCEKLPRAGLLKLLQQGALRSDCTDPQLLVSLSNITNPQPIVCHACAVGHLSHKPTPSEESLSAR